MQHKAKTLPDEVSSEAKRSKPTITNKTKQYNQTIIYNEKKEEQSRKLQSADKRFVEKHCPHP
jgi:hypothetical protein